MALLVHRWTCVALGLALGACGGGGGTNSAGSSAGGGSSGVPAINFNTQEYRDSLGSVSMNAIAAYNANATGQGITVGIIDTGINTSTSEFAGRISSASRDVVSGSSRSISDQVGHGTAVASIIGAARNGSGIMGVAFNSTLAVMRADSPGQCASMSNCTFFDSDIANGVNIAVANGARVINISLGGNSSPSASFVNAIANAASRGVIVVIAAGNDSAANPDAFALVANNGAAQNMVIIAGSHDGSNNLSGFSNAAGSGASHYLVALGSSVPALDQNGGLATFSGTSFATPQIAGAAALLAQAFPNLTGAQIVDLLFSSAVDLGAAGTDSTFGRGRLDLTRAFQPVGTTSLASTGTPLSLTSNGSLGAPLGDGGQTSLALNGAIILDGFSRPFAVNLAGTLSRTPVSQSLYGKLQGNARAFTNAAGPVMVSVSVSRNPSQAQPWVGLAQSGLTANDARIARATAGAVISRIAPGTRIAFGFSESGVGLIDRMSGRTTPAFLVAGDAQSTPGFQTRRGNAVALAQDAGRLMLSTSMETGDAVTWAGDRQQRRPYNMAQLRAIRGFGPLMLDLGLGLLDEQATLLGSNLSPAFGVGGAATRFADAGANLAITDNWYLSARVRQGWTTARMNGGLVSSANIVTRGFAVDLAGSDLFSTGDRLGFRIAQPLRVESGGMRLNMPVAFDFASRSATLETRNMALSPSGREIDLETSYGFAGLGGWMDLNAYWRRDPGHIANTPDDRGVAWRYNTSF